MREAVEKIMDKYRLNEKLATAKEALIHDRTINKFDYTPIGALVTAAYAKRFQKEMPAYKDQPVIGVNHYVRPFRKGISPDCVPATSCLSAPLSLPIVSTASG